MFLSRFFSCVLVTGFLMSVLVHVAGCNPEDFRKAGSKVGEKSHEAVKDVKAFAGGVKEGWKNSNSQ